MNLPTIELAHADVDRFDTATEREWLLTNGLGGFAAGTIAGACTRRYHGLLVAALRPPVERTVLVAKLETIVRYRGRAYPVTSNEYGDGTIDPRGYEHIARFRLEGLMPVWEFVVGDALLEQRITMIHGENTTVVRFTMLRGGAPLKLELNPLCTYRDYHSQTRGAGWIPRGSAIDGGCEVEAFDGARRYRLLTDKGAFRPAPGWYWNFKHRAETARGLDDREDLFSPGVFDIEISPGETVTLWLTTERAPQLVGSLATTAERRREEQLLSVAALEGPEWIEQLALAADQFIVQRGAAEQPLGGRPKAPAGRTIIAGYPWFSDWGRDTMIALPGLALTTGRHDIAAGVLRTFAMHVSEGMLPNRFPDAGETPEYNTVDATLWYFSAIDKYLAASGDRQLVAELYPVLLDVVEWHLKGTRYGIRVDGDGLLRAGEPGVQLTWMDAKVGDWVVTPRIGKPVEINALWYRALVIMQSFAALMGDHTAERRFASLAGRALRSFRRRYWSAERGYLADVVDGPNGEPDRSGGRADFSLRPNQIFAVAIDKDLLEPEQARAVVDVCARELWTPLGLRSLAPKEAGFVGRYGGGPRERDGAYHQGTVWSWLLGPFAIAHYNVYRNAHAARAWLQGIAGHLRHACVGSVSEIFDGDAPHRPEGCFAQAWSVAEVLRAWVEIGALAAEEDSLKGERA
jgi:predicted glycogen debranching enzyme